MNLKKGFTTAGTATRRKPGLHLRRVAVPAVVDAFEGVLP
jgi:hypothetical protein